MNSYSLGAVRGLVILETLADWPEGGITELSRELGWSKATVHRVLQALVDMGYVRQDQDTKRYCLTAQLFEVGSKAIHRTGLTRAALPVMQELYETTGETVNLAVLDGADVVFIQKIDSDKLLGENIKVGSAFPAHCTALGKALLAQVSGEKLEVLYRGQELDRWTPNSLSTYRELKQELTLTRERGYAEDREELSLGLRCVAAHIRDASGKAIASVSLAGPTRRFTDDRLPRLVQAIVSAASEISSRLGFGSSSLQNRRATLSLGGRVFETRPEEAEV